MKKKLRQTKQYPALEKDVNLKFRKDFIEVDYINGVYNDQGQQIIRKLSDDEKAYLNKFYEETINTDFSHHPELKRLLKLKNEIIEDDTIKACYKQVIELKTQSLKLTNKMQQAKQQSNTIDYDLYKKTRGNVNKRIKELNQIIKFTKLQNEETYSDDLIVIEEQIQELRNEHLLYSDKTDHKQFYHDNYARRSCIYNRKLSSGQLDELNEEEYDEFMVDKIKDLDVENILISEIERSNTEFLEEKDSLVCKLDEPYVRNHFNLRKKAHQSDK